MLTPVHYTIVIALTAIERLIEVRVSKRNATWSFEQGGREFGKEHYPFMVVLHTVFLISCVVEAWLMPKDIDLVWTSVGLFLVVACQAFRWWCIASLGKHWNTRVILIPGGQRITKGPYRFLPHPNYMIVAVEGVVLPLLYQAWYTAIAFTLFNALLMWVRIRCEEDALREFLQRDKHASNH